LKPDWCVEAANLHHIVKLAVDVFAPSLSILFLSLPDRPENYDQNRSAENISFNKFNFNEIDLKLGLNFRMNKKLQFCTV